MLDIVILAAGKGTRMQSELPKVLHPIAGKPLVEHVIQAAMPLTDQPINIIVGHGAETVSSAMQSYPIQFIEQKQQLGTGHAVQQALPFLRDSATVLILYGDVPLIQQDTLKLLIQQASASSLGLLTVTLEDSTGYGRIVRNEAGQVTSIVEQKDASAEQLKIKEVNTGIMAVKADHLKEWLPALSNNNAQGEYYLTDIIATACSHDISVNTEQPAQEWEVLGVNDRRQQAQLERIYQQNLANQLMQSGVTLLDPARFDCRGSLTAGRDVKIDVNCIFEGQVVLGNNVTIGANCVIKNAQIGDNCQIKENTIVEDSQLEHDCVVGPFARLRPGTTLAAQAKIGNFVETKKATIGRGSKVNHLSYVGDATLGKDVNVGAGTITCNYDGINKHQTEIGDRVFVGSNTALVAPITLEDGVTVAAGSTLNRSVEKDKLAIARSSQKAVSGWQRPTKKS